MLIAHPGLVLQRMQKVLLLFFHELAFLFQFFSDPYTICTVYKGAAAYQLGNTSSCTITEVKQR